MNCNFCNEYIGEDILQDGVYDAMDGNQYCPDCGEYVDEIWYKGHDEGTKDMREITGDHFEALKLLGGVRNRHKKVLREAIEEAYEKGVSLWKNGGAIAFKGSAPY